MLILWPDYCIIWRVTGELHSALRLGRNRVHNSQRMYMQNDCCTHITVVTGNRPKASIKQVTLNALLKVHRLQWHNTVIHLNVYANHK